MIYVLDNLNDEQVDDDNWMMIHWWHGPIRMGVFSHDNSNNHVLLLWFDDDRCRLYSCTYVMASNDTERRLSFIPEGIGRAGGEDAVACHLENSRRNNDDDDDEQSLSSSVSSDEEERSRWSSLFVIQDDTNIVMIMIMIMIVAIIIVR